MCPMMNGDEEVLAAPTPAYYETHIDGVALDAEKIKVLWGETEYVCKRHFDLDNNFDWYGAPYDDYTNEFDFTEYPFWFGYSRDSLGLDIVSQFGEPVNVVITELKFTDAIWRKVGAGAPQGDLLFEGTLLSNYWYENVGYYYYDKRVTVNSYGLPETIYVEWDGTLYKCQEDDSLWGAPDTNDGIDFSEYPFQITVDSDETDNIYISAQNGDTHTMRIYGETVPEPQPELMTIYDGTFTATLSGDYYRYNATFDCENTGLLRNRQIFVVFDENDYTFSNTGVDWESSFGDIELYGICIGYDWDRGRVTFTTADDNPHTMTIQAWDREDPIPISPSSGAEEGIW